MRNTFNNQNPAELNSASDPVNAQHMQTGQSTERWPTIEIFRPFESCLTSKDYFVLERFLIALTEREGREAEYLARLIRTKLADARIVMSEDVNADVVTSGSRVTYSIDGGQPETRSLVFGETSPVPNYNLPIFTLLGVGLLGLKTGQTTPWTDYAGKIGKLTLQRVEYQPQSCRRIGDASHYDTQKKD